VPTTATTSRKQRGSSKRHRKLRSASGTKGTREN
jgi:hypothetical protein